MSYKEWDGRGWELSSRKTSIIFDMKFQRIIDASQEGLPVTDDNVFNGHFVAYDNKGDMIGFIFGQLNDKDPNNVSFMEIYLRNYRRDQDQNKYSGVVGDMIEYLVVNDIIQTYVSDWAMSDEARRMHEGLVRRSNLPGSKFEARPLGIKNGKPERYMYTKRPMAKVA